MTTDTLEKDKIDLFIPITEPSEQFNRHLNLKGNHRILFSSPFGTGKTTFLKEYFDKNKESYEVIHLFPVNYQVADNKDIFDLLKYDILCELIPYLNLQGEVPVSFKDKSIAFQYLLLTDGADWAFDILKQVPKLGKAVKGFQQIVKFCNKLGDLSKKQKGEKNELLKSFTEKIDSEAGSIYEVDPISNLIAEQIQNINTSEKETVLIIDDLDRVDPKHIFRLLNIFSAHFDQDSEIDNKFGFSKIIMVCDIKNIGIIYRKMYGDDVDFSGYIDKFRSIEYFNLKNEENWFDGIDLLFNDPGRQYLYGRYSRDVFHRFGVYLFKDLIYQGLISYRKLLKAKNHPELMSNLNTIDVKPDDYYVISRMKVFKLYKLVSFVFDGNKDEIQDSIKKLELLNDTFLSESICEYHLKELFYILHLKENSKYPSHELTLEINSKKIKYTTGNDGVVNIQHNIKDTYKDIYWICSKAFSIIKDLV